MLNSILERPRRGCTIDRILVEDQEKYHSPMLITDPEEVKEEDYYYSEREYGSFARMLSLPAKVQSDKIKASFKNGILEIHLPKAEEAKPKEVKVEVK